MLACPVRVGCPVRGSGSFRVEYEYRCAEYEYDRIGIYSHSAATFNSFRLFFVLSISNLKLPR